VKPVVVQSEAKAELRKARRWYDRRQFGLGDALLADVLDHYRELNEIMPSVCAGSIRASGSTASTAFPI
jgi:hypothetical protein